MVMYQGSIVVALILMRGSRRKDSYAYEELSSRKSLSVVREKFTDISDESTASIIMGEDGSRKVRNTYPQKSLNTYQVERLHIPKYINLNSHQDNSLNLIGIISLKNIN
jgi:hypothetical protein